MIRKLATTAMPLAAAIVLGCCAMSPVRAQAPTPPAVQASAPPQFQPRPIMDVNDPANKLHLTKDQQDKLNDIQAKFYSDRAALIANTKLSQADKEKQFQAMVAAAKPKVDSLLTPAQHAEQDKYNAQETKYLEGRNAAYGKAQQDKKQIDASLTPAQQKQLKALDQAIAPQLKAISDSTTMTMAQKSSKAMKINSLFQSRIVKVMTPKQAQLYADYNRNMQEASSLNRLAQETAL